MNPIKELWEYRFLIWNLAQRDLRSRYKKSILGWLWSLINPASTLVIFTVVFGFLLKGDPPEAANGGKNFGLWLFTGLVVWNFFASTVNGSITALSTSGGLLKKVYFPPTAPAVANLMVAFSQAVIEFTILGFFIIMFGNFSLYMFLFPITILLVGFFALGIGLWVSILNLYYRDIGYLVGIAMNMLFYLTPIVYSFNQIGGISAWGVPVSTVLKANPMTDFVELNRFFFYRHDFPGVVPAVFMVVATVVSLVAGSYMFSRKAQFVSEEI